MGGCASSVNEKGQDQEEKETDTPPPRQIAVPKMGSSEDALADGDSMSKTKRQCGVSVALASTCVVTEDARPQSYNTLPVVHIFGKMEHGNELETSTFDRHEKGGQGRFSQSPRTEDGSKTCYRSEDAGTVDFKLQIKELRSERDDMFYLNKDLTNEKDNLLKSIKQKDKEIDGLKTRNEDMELRIRELRNERNEMFKCSQDLVTKTEQLSIALVQKEKEIDDLRTRLSRVASDRLRDNYPNVADLSDRIRPTKVADRYTDVYSNEWSDAYEDLVATGDRTEQEAIQILLEFIENIYKMCLGISMEHVKNFSTHVLLFTGHTQMSTSFSRALDLLKNQRKQQNKAFLPTLYTETNKMRDLKLVKKSERTKKVQKYLDIATELCWLMCIQDPPVHLHTDCKHGHKFDEDSFSEYTVRGTKVDYLVWPALLLHKDGPILMKGIAQPKATKYRNKTKST